MKKLIVLSLIAPLCLLLISCQSKPISTNNQVQPIETTGADSSVKLAAEAIVQSGDNKELSVSNSGRYLLYSSGQRQSHTRYQCYLFDLHSKLEKRITWSDGDCLDPAFFDDQTRIIYSSSTDTIKEQNQLSFQKSENIPTNIYLSDIWGRKIRRLTKNFAQDRNPVKAWESESVFYLSAPESELKDGSFENAAKVVRLEAKSSSEVLKLPGYRILKLSFSKPSNKWLWAQIDKNNRLTWTTSSRSFKDIKPLPENVYLASWDIEPNNLWIAKQNANSTELAKLNIDTGAETYITTLQTKVLEIAYSAEKKQIIFVSDSDKQRKIFAVDLKDK